MKMELNFDEDIIFNCVYDTLFNFFLKEENMKALLSEETYSDILSELTIHIRDIFAETLPNQIDVFHTY